MKKPFLVSINKRLYVQWAQTTATVEDDVRKTDPNGKFKFHGELPWSGWSPSAATISLAETLDKVWGPPPF